MKKLFKFTCLFLCLLIIGTFTVACGGGGGGSSADGGFYFPINIDSTGNNGTNPTSPDAEYSFDNTKEASVSFTDGKTEKDTPTISSLESTLSIEMPDSWEITDTKNVEGLTKGNYRLINTWLYTTNDSGSASDKLTFNLPVNSGDRRTEKIKIKSGNKTYTLTVIQAGFAEDPEKRGNISADKTLFEVDSLYSTTNQGTVITLNSTKEKINITAPDFQGELKVLGGQSNDVSGSVAVDNYRVIDLTIYENPLGYRERKIRIFANTDYIDITVKQDGAFTVGQGTKDDPFIISSLDDLNKLSRVGSLSSYSNIMFADKNFKINSDISGITSPIVLPTYFGGYGKNCTIDGNGKKLTANINVTNGDASLFLVSGATIKNLTVAGKITANSDNNTTYYACGIAYGYSSAISDCINEAEVTANGVACGVCYGGTITNCTNKGKITGKSACGIGGSTVTDCTNKGKITGKSACGIGGSTVTDCTNKAEITASNSAYGITNSYNATVTNCTNETKVTGSNSASGISDSGNITNCVNKGQISGNSACGIGGSTVTDCTNEGDVTATDEYSGNASGITNSYPKATITNCTNKGKITASGSSSPNAGGISAETSEGSIISNCTNEGDVTSSGCAGGIVGSSYRATIKDCQHKSGIVKGEVDEYSNLSGYIVGNASDESGLKISGCKYKKTTGSTATKGVGNYEDSESGCENN